jgi:uncharacterized protein (DUF1499 family)
MPRRHLFDEPTSRLAVLSRRLALFSLAATILVIIIVRWGQLELWPALTAFAGALAFAVIALLVALAAFVVIWREGMQGMGHSITAILVAVALLAYPSYLGIKAYRLPRIYDVTTDPIDPPRYEALARVRPRDANPIIYAGLSAAELQRTAYPDIEPLEEDATPQAAYDAALAVITKRKWAVVDARPPQAGRREGHIEAVARTPVMGFRDDVVVRLRPSEGGTRIDIRSSSRYGAFDFGTNAARIRTLLDDIDDALDTDKTERPSLPAKKTVAAPKRPQPARR